MRLAGRLILAVGLAIGLSAVCGVGLARWLSHATSKEWPDTLTQAQEAEVHAEEVADRKIFIGGLAAAVVPLSVVVVWRRSRRSKPS
jgi:hypothetical protein